MKKLLQFASYILAVYLGGLLVSTTIAQRPPVGGGQRVTTAASNQTLLDVMSAEGLWRFPPFSSDPSACAAAQQGNTYYNTTDDEIKVCDGVGPTYVNSGITTTQLNDLTDVDITAPALNEVLRFNTVGSVWENQATSASDLNDLGDVDAAAPSDQDVLTFVTGSGNWENVAGAAPTTFLALTDTNPVSETDRDALRWDGTDWVNQPDYVDPGFYLFPVYDATDFSNASNAVITFDNQVKAFCWNFPYRIQVDRVLWAVDTVSGTGCDFGSVGIYSLDGNTRIIDAGPQAYSSNDVTIISDIGDTQLEAGIYYVAYTATETTSCTVLTETAPAGTNDGYEDLYLELANGSACKAAGTAANSSTAGQLPTTLGVVTFNPNIQRPIIIFEGN